MIPEQPQPTGDLTTDLGRAIVWFPFLVIQWVLSLLYLIVTDGGGMLAFTLLSLLIGFSTGSWLLGLTAFFTIYAIQRIVSAHAQSIYDSASAVAQSFRFQQTLSNHVPAEELPHAIASDSEGSGGQRS
jgi:hypothetical protein